MEHPNATWNDFSTHIIQKDVSFQVSSNFLNYEEQTKAELATLGREMKNLQTESITSSQRCGRHFQTRGPKSKRKTERYSILILLPHKWTHPQLV